MKCPNCQKEFNEGMKFCTGCGAKLPEIIRCENCGKILSPNIKFCTGCGTKVKKKDNSVIESENVTTPEPEIQDNTNQNEQSEVIPEPQYEESPDFDNASPWQAETLQQGSKQLLLRVQ